MSDEAGTCSFTVDCDMWKKWGGAEEDWLDVLDNLGMEDNVWKCPHSAIKRNEVHGANRCVFHLHPDEVPDEVDEKYHLQQAIEGRGVRSGKRRLRLKQFLGATFGPIRFTKGSLKVEDGLPIWLSGATFFGEVSISTNFQSPIIAWYTEFHDNVTFEESEFHEEVSFTKANFHGESNFAEAKFHDEVGFIGVEFNDDVAFWHSEFICGAKFGDAKFLGDVSFVDAHFKDKVSFGGSEFYELAGFSEAQFDETAWFWGAIFRGNTVFVKAEFRGEALFRNAVFDNIVQFWMAKYGDKVTFQEARFNGEVHFSTVSSGTEFSNPPIFTSASLTDSRFADCDLSGAKFDEANLTDSDFSNTVLRGANFETATLSRSNLFGSELRGAALAGAVLSDARIDDETKFFHPPVKNLPTRSHFPLFLARFFSDEPVLPTCGYDPAFTPPNNEDEDQEIDYPEENLDKAKSVYRAIENLASLSSRPRLEGRAFVRRQDIQCEQYRRAAKDPENSHLERFINRGRSVRASISRAIMLYGQSPWRVVGTALSVIFMFALLYPLGGWMQPTICSADNPATSVVECAPLTYANGGFVETLLVIGQSLYYSTLTFTTLGFGDFRPVGFGQVLTTIETGLGAVLIALLVFVLGRRAAQ